MKTVFWNVDTQYDFMRNDESFKGALPVQGAREIEGNLEKLTRFARENQYQIINTADWHTENSAEFSDEPDYVNSFPAHCLIGTKGAMYVPATAPQEAYIVDWRDDTIDEKLIVEARELVLYKDAFDIFSENPFADDIVDLIKPEKALVYGVATNVCVDFAVRGLLERDVDVYVIKDAIKELPGDPTMIIKAWEDGGAKIIDTQYAVKMNL
jgi:nicotinamidase/pyrazinamidase